MCFGVHGLFPQNFITVGQNAFGYAFGKTLAVGCAGEAARFFPVAAVTKFHQNRRHAGSNEHVQRSGLDAAIPSQITLCGKT